MTITQVSLPLPLFKEGKVRVVYDLGDSLLMVTTDRISAFDVILTEGIPEKGAVLTQISAYWFSRLSHIIPNHLITTTLNTLKLPPEILAMLTGRSMRVQKTVPVPVECVVRGYIAGSAWAEYTLYGTIAGIPMPSGLQLASPLPAPIFTPAIKNDHGHDENISFAQLCTMIGTPLAEQLRQVSISLYTAAHSELENKGLILADTKFEFGHSGGQLLLIDEALTPDSSRYWDKSQYKIGSSPPSYDKQIVRDYLTSLTWDKSPPAPLLPSEIVSQTAAAYQALAKKICF